MQQRHSGAPTMGKPGAITQWARPTQTTMVSWGGRRGRGAKTPWPRPGGRGKRTKTQGNQNKRSRD
ncbi:hypothetical protein [Pasteuria penetrans]|uniref:hypothetical protein n=1 Tax=Pasteuria penetrans TaxID=86005 RepID=UPI0011EFD3A2|nr:hypothetical protein [Pasteuria penetrans]